MYKRQTLNCTAELKILTDAGVYFEALNARYGALSSTAYQSIFEVVIFRSRRNTALGTSIGPKALAHACNEHVRLASKSEGVSGAAALNAHDKALKLQPVIQVAHATFENSPAASQTPSLPEAKLHV